MGGLVMVTVDCFVTRSGKHRINRMWQAPSRARQETATSESPGLVLLFCCPRKAGRLEGLCSSSMSQIPSLLVLRGWSFHYPGQRSRQPCSRPGQDCLPFLQFLAHIQTAKLQHRPECIAYLLMALARSFGGWLDVATLGHIATLPRILLTVHTSQLTNRQTKCTLTSTDLTLHLGELIR